MNMMTSMELSSDLVEEILSWIPAKSLARLKYTCKQWETLILEPSFVMKHLSHMRCREQQFTVFNDVSNSETSWLSTVSCVGVDFDETTCEPNLNIQVLDPLPYSNLWVQNIYHCDGLLLLITKKELLVLNPVLKQARWIPCGDSVKRYSVNAYGLGYIGNQSSSSYKIVKFRCGSSRPKIQVYEFKYDRWRDVVDEYFGGFLGLPESSVCLRGTPYWLGFLEDGNTNSSFPTIQSFDFSKERFSNLFHPLSSKFDNYSLGVFKGDRLSLLGISRISGMMHLWVLNERWRKLLIIDVPKPLIFPKRSSYFIEKFGKLVLSARDLSYINSYIVAMDGGEVQHVQYPSMNTSISRSVCYYVPSLLPVPGGSFSRRN